MLFNYHISLNKQVKTLTILWNTYFITENLTSAPLRSFILVSMTVVLLLMVINSTSTAH